MNGSTSSYILEIFVPVTTVTMLAATVQSDNPLISWHCRRLWHATQDCVAPYADSILYMGQFWAISTASSKHGHMFRCFEESKVVLSQILSDGTQPHDAGCPGCLLQSIGGKANRICLASALSSIHAMRPNRVSWRNWIIAVSLCCFVSLCTLWFRRDWCHLMPSSIRRHHWSSASIPHASVFEITQQPKPYRNIDKMHVL